MMLTAHQQSNTVGIMHIHREKKLLSTLTEWRHVHLRLYSRIFNKLWSSWLWPFLQKAKTTKTQLLMKIIPSSGRESCNQSSSTSSSRRPSIANHSNESLLSAWQMTPWTRPAEFCTIANRSRRQTNNSNQSNSTGKTDNCTRARSFSRNITHKLGALKSA